VRVAGQLPARRVSADDLCALGRVLAPRRDHPDGVQPHIRRPIVVVLLLLLLLLLLLCTVVHCCVCRPRSTLALTASRRWRWRWPCVVSRGLYTILLGGGSATGAEVPSATGLQIIGLSLLGDAFIGFLQEHTMRTLKVKLSSMMSSVYHLRGIIKITIRILDCLRFYPTTFVVPMLICVTLRSRYVFSAGIVLVRSPRPPRAIAAAASADRASPRTCGACLGMVCACRLW
jgi:hypothetical protein